MTSSFRPYWATLVRGERVNTLHIVSADLEADYLRWGWEIQERECPYWVARKPAISETPNWKGVQLPERHSVAGYAVVDVDAMPYGGRCWDWSQRAETLRPSGSKSGGRDARPNTINMILGCFAQGYDYRAFIALGTRKPTRAERIHRECLCLGLRVLTEMGYSPKALIRATGLTTVQVSRLKRAKTPLLFANREPQAPLPDINIIDSRNGSTRWTDSSRKAPQVGGRQGHQATVATGRSVMAPARPPSPNSAEEAELTRIADAYAASSPLIGKGLPSDTNTTGHPLADANCGSGGRDEPATSGEVSASA